MGGREAPAYFTGQDRVKNKTAANSTPRVLQGLSMTPSFPPLPQAREYLPRGPPHPRCSGFWLLCKQLSDLGMLCSQNLCPGPHVFLHHPSAFLAFPKFSPPLSLRLWMLRDKRQGRDIGPCSPACPWVAVACRWRFGRAACVNGLVVLSDGGEGGCRCRVASPARPTTL